MMNLVGMAMAAALTLVAFSETAAARGAWERGRDDGAECLSAYGETRCGFDCKAAYGEVRCAATPAGVCEAAYGKVTCWDPPRRRGGWRGGEAAKCVSAFGETRCGFGCVAAYGEIRCGERPGATCLAAYGEIACGFGCKAAYGEVRCAKRPGGICEAAYGEIVCSD